jgi:hypothetical protein
MILVFVLKIAVSVICIVLLPGFQNGRDINTRLLKEKGREQFWPKKGNASYKENLKNGPNFTTFRVNKMFSHKF